MNHRPVPAALRCHGYRLLCYMPDGQDPEVTRAVYARGSRLYHTDTFPGQPRERPDSKDPYPADRIARLIMKSRDTVTFVVPKGTVLALLNR